MPTTSPLRKLILIFLHTSRSAYRGCSTVQSFTSNRISPIQGVRGGKRSDRFLPTIALIIRSSLQSSIFLSKVFITEPSLITVILSATKDTSFNLCEIIIDVIFFFLNSSNKCNNFCESVSFNEAVGSSRMRNVIFFAKAFAISTNCCLPIPISLISVRDDSCSPTVRSSASAFAKVFSQSILNDFPCSFPKKIFSAILRWGTRANS